MNSIVLSDKAYSELRKFKLSDESWDEFFLRLTKILKIKHPSDEEWDEAQKKVFIRNKETLQKLAK